MQKKTIILADDDEAICDAIKHILERAGHRVIIFFNGDAILAGQYEAPDIFILDKQFAGIDGLEICRHIKTTPATAGTPVIMLSASPHIKALAKQAGADDALEKPFAMQNLRNMVAHYLGAMNT